MDDMIKISFDAFKLPNAGTVFLFMDEAGGLGALARQIDEATGKAITQSCKLVEFKGKMGEPFEFTASAGGKMLRLVMIGTGKRGEASKLDWLRLGGVVAGKLAPAGAGPFYVSCQTADGALPPHCVAELALGLRLGVYRFDRYKTRKDEGEKLSRPAIRVSLGVGEAAACRKADQARQPVAEGIVLARDLVNLPANDLGPLEFAKQCQGLAQAGLRVEVLTEKEMAKLGMKALLGVGQGSPRGSRLVVMHWNGKKPAGKPLAFVGKGVVFDTGGISIKPAQNMEDMKGDMAGAACVTGLMLALAKRKAKVNAVGIVGLVENMPDGNAQRPGDVVRSMSGQTIEIINTDAEGRLVLADALWYCQHRFKPELMIDLATLTGAIMVALGQEYAGLFSNDDKLAGQLLAAAAATDEKIWRMPLAKAYDKIIDSKIADMKNSGGRLAGAVTAAQFLQRFVDETPWAHLDIAGTGMATSPSDISRSWAPGFGVRLLDQFVADHYEAAKT